MSAGLAAPWQPRRARRVGLALIAAVIWTLLACYPNPAVLGRNFLRYRHLPVDPGLAERIGWPLPRQAAGIESRVDSLLTPTPDWQLYRVPWYVPTPAEVVRSLRGDCESKAVLLASLLAGRHISFEVRASFGHIWLDYAGRKPRAAESRDLACLEGRPGRLALHWPRQVNWREVWAAEREQLWVAMPLARKALWLLGMLWVALGALLLGGPAPDGMMKSQWRVPGWHYLGRASWIGALTLGLMAAPWPGRRVARWTLADLWEALALSVLAGLFLAWLTILRSRRGASVSPDGKQLTVFSALGPWRRRRQLAAAEITHLELQVLPGSLRPCVVAAVLATRERVPLVRHQEEAAARAALRGLGMALNRAVTVRAEGVETRTEPEQIPHSLRERAEGRSLAAVLPRPRGCDLEIEESAGRWVMRYPATGRGWLGLLALALFAVVLMVALTCAVLLRPWVIAFWIGWLVAAAYLSLNIYLAVMLRGEIVARLAGVRVEIGEGELGFRTPERKVERVQLSRIETVELSRVGETPTIAIVSPEQVLHLRDICAPEHRPWVRQMIEQAVRKMSEPTG